MKIFKLGLTGSMGMGKSTTALMFRDAGCHLWDADAAVHRLYAKSGLAVAPLQAAFPELAASEEISREALRQIIASDNQALTRIESIVHPLVAEDRAAFLASIDSGIVVFDIPLLFETGGDEAMDAVVCVDIDAAEQEARILARGTMTRDDMRRILAKQLPNSEKVALSDYVIVTDTLEHAQEQVEAVVANIRERMNA